MTVAFASESLAAQRTFRARRSGWWVSFAAHGSAVVALVVVGSRAHRDVPNAPPALVEFDAPPPPPPPRAVTPPPPPPPTEVPTPQPAVQREEPVHHAPPPRAARVVAPPPIMTAPAAGGDSNNAMESGSNTAFHGGDVGEPHEATPTPPTPPVIPAPPAPIAPVARGPVQLPENASPPEPEAGNASPEYPASARASGVQATVIARIVVNDDGSVGRVEILRGHPDFNAAVEAALRHWRYRPARVDGHPLAVFQVVRVPFRLENL